MSKKRSISPLQDKLKVGSVMPLSELIDICSSTSNDIRIWIQTSSPPLYLPVDRAFLRQRTAEFYDHRKYHGVWVKVTMNDWVSHKDPAIHCKYETYRDPIEEGKWKQEEKERNNTIKDKLLKIAKTHNHAKDQNLHIESIRKIRERGTLR